MFETYLFDHPETDESRLIDGRSYFWASLFGPLYVLSHGFPLHALLMVPICAALAFAAFVAFFLVDSFLSSGVTSIVALAAMIAAALVAQGIAAIRVLRVGYLGRGWRGGY
ncbi:MAG: hypothetical protein K9G48_01960 [Reyranella sp.]|nr:hypothetical protein [Reyranella sp.]